VSKAFDYDDRQSPETPEAALSALLDGEASEFEVRRLLEQVKENPGLLEKWQRYSLGRSVLEGEPFRQVSPGFSDRVREAVARSADGQRYGSVGDRIARHSGNDSCGRQWARPLGRIAVAASVAVAVFLGMELSLEQGTSRPEMVAGGSEGAASGQPRGTRIDIDADAQQRLNEYIQSVTISGSESRDSVSNAFEELERLRQTPRLRPVADRELLPATTETAPD